LDLDANLINLLFALVGFLVMMGILGGIGINKPRGMSVKMWCVGYLGVAIGFDIVALIGLIGGFTWLTYLLVGLSAGAATGLAIHVMHHINEENENPTIMGL
jgi:hypothetical protein